jgi:hypothetical protein
MLGFPEAFDEIKRSEDHLRLVIDTIPTLVWRAGPRLFAPDFSFFHKIQRAEALLVKQVGCAQLSDTFRANTVMTSAVSPNASVLLPPLIAGYVEATNSFDLERLMATFAEDALVNDQLRDYRGKPAIREWAKRDIVGERLTMNVTKVIKHYGNFIVTANIDGNYDKRGLPDPLVLAFYFSAQSDLIVQLIILRNRFDI